MSVKKATYYIIDKEMNAGYQDLPVKTEAIVTVKFSKRTVADSQRCLEICTESIDAIFKEKGFLHQIFCAVCCSL